MAMELPLPLLCLLLLLLGPWFNLIELPSPRGAGRSQEDAAALALSERPAFIMTTLNDSMAMIEIGTGSTLKTISVGKPYDEYIEVKIAVLIDRVYIPVLVMLGLVGNSLSFLTLIFSSLRNTSTCVYMAVIAVLDSVVLVLDLCVLIRGYLGHTRFYLSNNWTCGLHNFLFYLCIHWAVMVLVAMTADRFLVVQFPLKAQSLSSPRSALLVAAGIGLFSFALNFQILFTRNMGAVGTATDPLQCIYTDPNVDFFMRKIYTWIDASIYSFIPFLSLLVFNVLIVRQLRSSRKFNRQFKDGAVSTGKRSSGGRAAGALRIESDDGNSAQSTVDHCTSTSEVSFDSGSDLPAVARPAGSIGKQKFLSSSSSSSSNNNSSKSKANITLMLLLVSFTFLLMTCPVAVVLLYKRYYWLPATNPELARARLVHAFVDNLAYTNHAVNFLLYCLSGRRFRNELGRLLQRLAPWK